MTRHFFLSNGFVPVCGLGSIRSLGTDAYNAVTCKACRRTKVWSETHDDAMQHQERERLADDGIDYASPGDYLRGYED